MQKSCSGSVKVCVITAVWVSRQRKGVVLSLGPVCAAAAETQTERRHRAKAVGPGTGSQQRLFLWDQAFRLRDHMGLSLSSCWTNANNTIFSFLPVLLIFNAINANPCWLFHYGYFIKVAHLNKYKILIRILHFNFISYLILPALSLLLIWTKTELSLSPGILYMTTKTIIYLFILLEIKLTEIKKIF